GIFKVALNHKKLGITKEILATKSLPFLFPLSIENSLTPSQHSAIMALIKDMTDKVEAEHRTKLIQLHSIQEEKNTLQMAMPTSISVNSSTSSGSVVSAADVNTGMFSGLGLNQYMKKESMSSPKSQNSVQNTYPNPDVLTLEDKQRMVKEQGIYDRDQQQPISFPSPPAPYSSIKKLNENQVPRCQISTPSSQVADSFTSSLIDSSLSMMINQSSQPSLASKTFPQRMPSSSGIMNSINNCSMNYGGRLGGVTTLPESGVSSWASQATSQSVRMQMPNLSTFDNLLSSQSKPVSMNQIMNPIGNTNVASSVSTFSSMISPMQPMNTSSFSSVLPTGVKPLSSSDINELLS
ncbi:hypothetical protein OTU49_016959, partial [Cherax quadricarinatus]